MRQILLALLMATTLTACAQTAKTYKVKITFEKNGEPQMLTATFDDNATTLLRVPWSR